MAKYDDKRARNELTYQTNLAQNNLDVLRKGTINPQNEQFWSNYMTSVDQAKSDYADTREGFKSALPVFQNFAATGGFSPTDISNMRSRALSPTKAVYANANREVDRSRALQGGYSPGYGVLKARMARDLGTQLSDQSTGVEANLAQMINEGKLKGASGISDVYGRLAQLYGTTPGMANMFGNQALQSSNQALDVQQLQNQLSLGRMQNQIQAGQLPGTSQSVIGNIKNIADIGTGAIYPWAVPNYRGGYN